MTENPSTLRERLLIDPAAVIEVLPQIGKLMITAKHGGATHERIGSIEALTQEEGYLVCSGAEHASRIDAAKITEVIVDRTSIMGGNVYPRIDFHTEETVLFSVVGFGGLEPFDAALARFGHGQALDLSEKPASERKEQVADPVGAAPFETALGTAQPVTIRFTRPGFTQHWAGVIEKVSPSGGFINVMRPDFHLHLRTGSVDHWRRDARTGGAVLVAIGPDGQELGLSVHGTIAALLEVQHPQATP